MSSIVDSRVLEMQFDNKEFEANARETINTINDLKKALDENVNGSAFEELDRAARNVDLSSIEHSLDALTDRFSTLGIVGMRVIENLTDGLMNLVHRGLNYVTDAISSGGIKRAMNIENARFQLQGLIDDEKEVEAIMQNAQQSVSDTAYSYDEAAKAASMFAATGLRSGEQMQSALDGIAGVAATTNSDYESMAQIFTTVAGNGRLMGDQLLQLSTRGMNAAAVLRNFFNEVRDGSRDASDHVKDFVNQLSGMNTGASDAAGNTFDNYDDAIKSTQKAFNKQYKERQKALNKEFEVIKNGYDEEYNSLKKTLDSEYNAKKKAYDEEYQALSESLSKEIQEVQKANAQRLKEANEAYSEQVEAYRNATEARIQLINDEYLESIKLIDEERYNKLKAIDDELKAMQELEEAESRQRINEANAEKKAAIEDLASRAKSKRARLEAAEAVADVNKAIADQQEAWRKEDRKKELSEQKDQINEDANLKKQEALSKKDAAVKSVQDEASAKLKEMHKAHEVEIEQMRESQQVQIEELQKSKQAQLETLRESQQNELSQYRETQQLQLQSFRETQQEELEAIRERNQEELEALRELNNDKLSEMREASKVGVQALKDFNGEIGFTEEQIRDMVSKGLIDFETFAEAMDALFGDHAKDANKTFSGAMANIRAALARTGAMFAAPFIEQEGPMVKLFNAIRIKINEMNAALAPVAKIISANILQAVINLTDRIENLRVSLTYMVKDANGNVKEYSKLSTIASVLVNIFKGLADIFMAIGSYISPIINAFKEIFSIDYTGLLNASKSFRDFTRDLGASEETAKIIHDAFKLLFELIRNGITIVVNFIKEFKPLHTLVGLLASGINFLATGISIVIGSFVEWITTCKPLKDAIEFIVEGLKKFVDKVKEVKDIIGDFLKDKFGGFDLGSYFAEGFLAGFQKMGKAVIDGIISFFNYLKTKVQEVFGIESPSKWAMWIVEMIFEGLKISFEFMMNDLIPFVVNLFRVLINAVTELVTNIDWVSIFTNISNFVSNGITNITDTIANGIPIVAKKISDFFTGIQEDMRNYKLEKGEGSLGWNIIFAILEGMQNAVYALGSGLYKIAKTMYDMLAEFFRNFSIKEAISIAIEFVKTFAGTLVEKLGEWKDAFGKALKDFFGNIDSAGILAIAAGITIIYMFIKACGALFKLMTPMTAVTGAINGLKQAFIGFAWDMKANALLKMSVAIAIIAATIGLMFKLFQMVNDEKAEDDMLKAVAVVGVAVLAIGTIVTATNIVAAKINTAEGAIGQIGIAAKKIAAALEVKIIIASVVSALSAIILDIAALATIYAANGDAFNAAIDAIMKIGKGLLILIGGVLFISGLLNPSNLQTFAALTGSLLAFSASIILIVLAIQKITSLEIGKGDLKGLAALAVIILLVGSVMKKIIKASSSIGNESSLTLKIGTIVAFALLMVVAINALKKLIKENYTLQKDYPQLAMLAVLMGLITVVCVALAKAGQKSEGSVKYGSAVIGLAALLLASIYAIKKLIEIPFDEYLPALGKLALLFITMGIAVRAAASVTSNDGYKSILAVGILVGALLIVMGVMTMLDPTKSLAAAGLLAVLLIALGVALTGAGEMATTSTQGFGAILVMLGMIIAIALIMRMLLKHDWQEMLAVSGSIALVLVALGAAMKLASGTKFNKTQLGAFIVGLLAMLAIGAILSNFEAKDWKNSLGLAGSISLVLVAMAGAMKLLGSGDLKIGGGQIAAIIFGIVAIAVIGHILTSLKAQDWKSMLAIAATISLVLVAMGAAIMLMGDGKYGVSAGAVISFIAGILGVIVIGSVLTSLQTQDWKGMLALAGAISLVLVAMGAAIMLIGQSENGVSAGAATAMIFGLLTVAVVGAVIGMCAQCDWQSMIGLGAAISEVLLAMGAAILIMGSSEYSLDAGAVVGFIVGLIGAAIVGAIIGMFATQPWEQMVGLGTAISEVLLAMGAAILIMGDTKVSLSAMAAFAEAGLAVWGIAWVIQNYSKGLDLEGCLALSTGVAILLVSMAIVTGILALIGPASVGAIEGAAALDAVIAIIGGLIAGIGALYQIQGFAEIMEAGAEGLAKIGEAIGGFFGGIAKGFTSEILDLIPLLGEKLSEFTEKSKGFFDMLQGFDEGMAKAALAFAGVLLAIGTAELLDAVTNIVSFFTGGGDLASYGEKLAGFGQSMKTFYDNTEGIENPYRLKNIAEAAKSLLELGQLVPNEGGLLGDIMGNNPLDKFGEALASFSADLITVYDNFGAIEDLDRFGKIAEAMTSIIQMAKDVPNAGGAVAEFLGDNTLDVFGEQLVVFSKSLKDVGINFGKVENLDIFDDVAKAMMSIINMAVEIPNAGGYIAAFLGDNDLGTFGNSVREFAKQICAAAVYAESANLDIMDKLAKSMISTLSVAKYVKENGLGEENFFTRLNGDDSLAGFGRTLVDFSSSIKEMTTGGNLDSIDKFERLANALVKFKDIVGTLNSFNGSNFISFLSDLGNKGSEGVTKFLSAFDNVDSKIQIAVNSLFSAIKDVMERASNQVIFINAGKSLMGSFAEGLTDTISIQVATIKIISAISKDLTSDINKNMMKIAGMTVSADFAEGLSNDVTIMPAAMGLVASLAKNLTGGLNTALLENAGKVDILAFSNGFIDESIIKLASDRVSLLLNAEMLSTIRTALLTASGKMNLEAFLKGFIDSELIRTGVNYLYGILNPELLSVIRTALVKASGKVNLENFLDGFSDQNIVSKGVTILFGVLAKDLTGIIRTALIKASGKINLEAFLTGFLNEEEIGKAVSVLFTMHLIPELNNNLRQALVEASGRITAKSFASEFCGSRAKEFVTEAASKLINHLTMTLVIPENKGKVSTSSQTLMEVFSKAMNLKEVHGSIQESSNTLIDFVATCLTKGSNFASNFNSPERKFKEAGIEDGRAFASGFEGRNIPGLSEMMYNFAADVSDKLYDRRITRLFEDAGKNAAYGFADGMRDSRAMDEVKRAASDMAYEAYDEAMYALDEHSPSKKMMQVGAYAGEGFALGLEEWISAAGEAGYDVGDTALDGLREAMKDISENIQNEDDFNPVITPVLDLSNIEEGVGQIGGMLDINNPINFNTASIANPMMTQTDQLREGYMQGAQYMFDRMSEELEYYKQQNLELIETMGRYMGNLQVVMDSGELVGVLTNPIDDELGFKKKLNARGVG